MSKSRSTMFGTNATVFGAGRIASKILKLGCASIAALVVSLTSSGPALSAWSQAKYTIGTAYMSHGYSGAATDTATVSRILLRLAGAHINLVHGGEFLLDLPAAQGKKCLKVAANLGIQVLAPGIHGVNTPLNPANYGGLTSPEWGALAGYYINGVTDDHLPLTSAQVQDHCTILHAPDPNKLAFGQSIDTPDHIAFRSLPPPGNLDMMITEDYALPAALYLAAQEEDRSILNAFYFNDAANNPRRWAYVYGSGGPDGLPNPTDFSLRRMALWPSVFGATGILWWHFDFPETLIPEKLVEAMHPGLVPTMLHGHVPMTRFHQIAQLNHYLKDIVGPAVMRSTYLGQWHNQCGNEDYPVIVPCFQDPRHYKIVPSEQRELIHQLGAHTMAGVWRSNDEPAGTYYLLVANRSESSISTTVVLKGTEHLRVGGAPSVIGYTGLSEYAPVSTTNGVRETTQPDNLTTTFSVDLAADEVRVFKVMGGSSDPYTAITSPMGGESYSSGQSVTFSWSRSLSNVRVRLFTDVHPMSGITGPYVDLATGTSGQSWSGSLPLIAAASARVEISGTTVDANPTAVTITHQTPIHIVPSYISRPTEDVRPTAAYAMTALARAPDGTPHVASLASYGAQLKLSERTGGGWTTSDVSDAPAWSSYWYGLNPSLQFGADGTKHLAFFTLYAMPAPESHPTHPYEESQLLRYHKLSGGVWTRETVAYVGTAHSNTAMAIGSDGSPYIAFNAGSFGNCGLSLAHREATGWQVSGSHFATGNARSISLKIGPDGVPWLGQVASKTGVFGVFRIPELDDWETALGITGVGDFAEFNFDAAGNPVVAYTKAGSTPGSSRIYFRTTTLDEETWTYVLGAEQLVTPVESRLTGLSLSQGDTERWIGYVSNGNLREASQALVNPDPWSLTTLVGNQDAEGPLKVSTDPTGDRWYAYHDRSASKIRAIHIVPPGPGGPEPPPEEPILHAIKLAQSNPHISGNTLRFQLQLQRASRVAFDLIDVSGRRIAHRADVTLEPGSRSVEWNPGRFSAGIYFLRPIFDGKALSPIRLAFVR